MGYLLAITAIFFWSWNIIIASSFAYTLAPFEIAFGRWLVASIVLVGFNYKILKKYFFRLLQNWRLILSMTLTGVVFDNTLIYYAGETASAVDIGLLGIIGPIFLVLLSRIFLKTPVSLRQTFGMIVAIVGVIAIITNGNFGHLSHMKFAIGDFIVIINTLCFAVYSLLQSLRPKDIPQKATLAATAALGTIMLFILMLIFVPVSQLRHFTAIDAGVICYLGIFNSVISYLAWNTALAKIGNLKSGIIYYLLPIFSGIEAYLVLHENISYAQIIGGLVVIGGVFIVSWPVKKKLSPAASSKTNR